MAKHSRTKFEKFGDFFTAVAEAMTNYDGRPRDGAMVTYTGWQRIHRGPGWVVIDDRDPYRVKLRRGATVIRADWSEVTETGESFTEPEIKRPRVGTYVTYVGSLKLHRGPGWQIVDASDPQLVGLRRGMARITCHWDSIRVEDSVEYRL